MLEIAGPSGRIEALLDQPAPAGAVGADGLLSTGHSTGLRAAVVFAHPHTEMGGTMHTKVVYQAAKALGRIGCAVLRFNFRGAGKSAGAFSNGPGEMDDFRSALDYMGGQYPAVPLWAGGMSFGSWIALTVGAADPRVTTLIGIALPVSTYDFEPVARSTKAKFFIQAERDEICPLKNMREFYARAAEPKELVVIDGADHLFDGKVGDVADAIEELLGDWT
ncbi:MAG TPA: alpha/beta family hydrolase [Vicinamibacterales bacterium]|nr:alpha/beta family hydrolase [Vicinamibacterales bacterium]